MMGMWSVQSQKRLRNSACLCLRSCACVCASARVCVFVGRLRLETRLVHLFISARFFSPAAGKMKGLPQYRRRVCLCVCVCVCVRACTYDWCVWERIINDFHPGNVRQSHTLTFAVFWHFVPEGDRMKCFAVTVFLSLPFYWHRFLLSIPPSSSCVSVLFPSSSSSSSCEVCPASFLFYLFFLLCLSLALSAAICSFVSLWLCCCHTLAWWLTLPFRTEKHYKRKTWRVAEREWKPAGKKELYLASVESPRLAEARTEGKRKALIKVSTRKAFLSPPMCSHSLSARINAPKSPKARSSYILSIIQPASFVQPLLFTRTAWPIVNVCVPAEPPSPRSHTRWLHSDLAPLCHPPPPPRHSHLCWRRICQAGTAAAVEAASPGRSGQVG